ncbi:WxL domain-containing protein, partial [Enterococcus hirae]|uniref:WxL domain-containing protein n=1 Tax=Enterococcus hirae TaxID=1354 RepID=UPI001A95BCA3
QAPTEENIQSNLLELPEELKGAKYERLSDGRFSVDISTFDELKNAFVDKSIGQVNFLNDIEFSSNIVNYTNDNLVINGNGYTLNFGSQKIGKTFSSSAGVRLTLENINTATASSGNGEGAISTRGDITITMRNVKHTGMEFAWASKFIFEGNVDINVSVHGDGWTPAISSCYNSSTDGGYIKVSEGANVNIMHSVSTEEVIGLQYISNILVGSGAKFTINSTGTLTYGVLARQNSNVGISIEKDSEFTINSKSKAYNGKLSSIDVSKSGSLNFNTEADYAIYTTSKATIDLSGATFNIQSTKQTGRPLYMGTGSTLSFAEQDIRAWEKGLATADTPNYAWDNVTAVVTMSGYQTKSVNSENTKFVEEFKNQNFSRISSNGYTICQTTINEVKDTDTMVSGTGEPGGMIELKVENEVIAYGVVSIDGTYCLTIPKQMAGTVIKAIVKKNGLSSEAETTVVEDSNNNETVDPTPGEDGGDVVVPPAQEGSFAIAYAPSFDFGSQEITSQAQTYQAKYLELESAENPDQTRKRAHFAQVRDLRGDATKGWTLTAAQTKEFTNGTSKLTGAQIKLSNNSVKKTVTSSNVMGHDLTLSSDASTVMNANVGEGQGISSIVWGETVSGDVNSSVELDVLANSDIQKGAYSSEITWMLQSVPS